MNTLPIQDNTDIVPHASEAELSPLSDAELDSVNGGIIAILIGLLLPAVQTQSETKRLPQ